MSCNDKPFLTYKNQFKRLNEKGISCTTTEEKNLVIRKGYFNLINGYKKPFVASKDKMGNHIYFKDTSVFKIYRVMKFDKKISSLLLKNITHIEEELRTITAHQFAKVNIPLGLDWNYKNAYDDKVDEKFRKDLIGKIKYEIKLAKENHNEYVLHYLEKDKIIPLWVMIKVIRFTTFIRFIELSKKEIRIFLSKLYNIEYNESNNDFRILLGSLQWIRKVRNSCAHNERVMFLKDDDKVTKTYMHKELARSYTHPKRTKQLIDVLIYLKYFNRKTEYATLINNITMQMNKLEKEVGFQVFERVRGGMGIKSLEHLKHLRKAKKTIDFVSIK